MIGSMESVYRSYVFSMKAEGEKMISYLASPIFVEYLKSEENVTVATRKAIDSGTELNLSLRKGGEHNVQEEGACCSCREDNPLPIKGGREQ
jgi:hypothetical protein